MKMRLNNFFRELSDSFRQQHRTICARQRRTRERDVKTSNIYLPRVINGNGKTLLLGENRENFCMKIVFFFVSRSHCTSSPLFNSDVSHLHQISRTACCFVHSSQLTRESATTVAKSIDIVCNSKLTETKDLQASVQILFVGIRCSFRIHDRDDIEEHHQLDDNNHHHDDDPRDDIASNVLWARERQSERRKSRTFTLQWHDSLQFQTRSQELTLNDP